MMRKRVESLVNKDSKANNTGQDPWACA